jgi:hypothetical protein
VAVGTTAAEEAGFWRGLLHSNDCWPAEGRVSGKTVKDPLGQWSHFVQQMLHPGSYCKKTSHPQLRPAHCSPPGVNLWAKGLPDCRCLKKRKGERKREKKKRKVFVKSCLPPSHPLRNWPRTNGRFLLTQGIHTTKGWKDRCLDRFEARRDRKKNQVCQEET